jgi:hypothetical protein
MIKNLVCVLAVISSMGASSLGALSSEPYKGYNYYEYSVTDATEAQKIVVGLADSNDYLSDLYDVNNDGTLDVTDATAIQKDVVRSERHSNDIDIFNNGSDIAKVAYSYYSSGESYGYKEGSIFNSDSIIRDENGTSYMDNLTFVGLTTMGVDYSNSPYGKHKGNNATWNPESEVFNYNVYNSPFSSLILSLMFKYDYYDEKVITSDVVSYLDENSMVVLDRSSTGVSSPDECPTRVSSADEVDNLSLLRPGDIVLTGNGLGIISEKADGYFIFDESDSKLLYRKVDNEVIKVYRVNYNSLYS